MLINDESCRCCRCDLKGSLFFSTGGVTDVIHIWGAKTYVTYYNVPYGDNLPVDFQGFDATSPLYIC